MGESLVNRVGSNLGSKFYFTNDSWLRECIEYYTSENRDASLSAVEAFVISQWLLSDLREINNEKGCLPCGITQQAVTVLPGRYILQVDKMYDISQSKYSQLQKIRNVSEVNIKATAVETPAWEPKGKRMMQMFLNDGVQDLIAIEYKLIKTLKDTLLPGFKVMIIGPVTCRKGVMLLEEKNFKELGGEVDSILKMNALENVLARAVGMEENENPYDDEHRQPNSGETEIEFPEDEFDVNFDEISQIEQLSMESRESPVNPETVSNRGKIIGNNMPRRVENPNTNSGNTEMLRSIVDNQPSPASERHKNNQDDFKIASRSQLKPLIADPNNFQLSDNDFPLDEPFDLADFEDELDEDVLKGNKQVDNGVGNDSLKNIDLPKLPSGTSMAAITMKSPTLTTGKRSADSLSPVRSSPKIACRQTTPNVSKTNRKITEYTEKIAPKENLPDKICDFICDVMREPVKDIPIFKTVRGKVMQLGNLSKKDNNWNLKATITDNTASLEIIFASQVLEDLIGFTVPEFLEKRKLRKTNPEVDEYLRKCFRTAEKKVQLMDALMELEFSNNNKHPRVVSTQELTDEKKRLMEKRVQMMTV
ncbi:recQ-mediated genome instability protein 1 isoform X1 [Neodiprion lecontei]|uniref:RecQ-mediated genome instability protein 1 n=2 Tax=Neodiprion lecontei TaxID=441921 RepID=A0A6J0BIH7_NEOLC|nr:recQ-mediated genome instability protein 1 isoform X1 [Neodiprion lecontei]